MLSPKVPGYRTQHTGGHVSSIPYHLYLLPFWPFLWFCYFILSFLCGFHFLKLGLFKLGLHTCVGRVWWFSLHHHNLHLLSLPLVTPRTTSSSWYSLKITCLRKITNFASAFLSIRGHGHAPCRGRSREIHDHQHEHARLVALSPHLLLLPPLDLLRQVFLGVNTLNVKQGIRHVPGKKQETACAWGDTVAGTPGNPPTCTPTTRCSITWVGSIFGTVLLSTPF